MKKLFTILFCLLTIVASADERKMALLQPRVAEGSDACRPMELNMVRGELRKAFGWQSDFQVLTRTDVDQMLKELGFQQSGMVDDNQRKKVGEMTGAQYICVSTITKDGTQLYIESYLVNVETGQMTNPATQYANVLNNDYSILQNPCNELAREMLGELGGTPKKNVQPASPSKVTANTEAVNYKGKQNVIVDNTQVANDKEISILAYGKPIMNFYTADHEFDGTKVEYRVITRNNPNPAFQYLGTAPFAYLTSAEAKVLSAFDKKNADIFEIRPLIVENGGTVEFRLSKDGYKTVVVKPMVKVDFGGKMIMIPLNKIK